MRSLLHRTRTLGCPSVRRGSRTLPATLLALAAACGGSTPNANPPQPDSANTAVPKPDATVTPPASRPTLDAAGWARSATLTGTCAPTDTPQGLLTKALYRRSATPAFFDAKAAECLLTTTQCKGLKRCVGLEAAPFDSDEKSRACRGDVVSYQAGDRILRMDCGRVDATCVDGQGCRPIAVSSCSSAQAGTSRCDGDTQRTCNRQGKWNRGLDCSSAGAHCQQSDQGAACVGTGEACDGAIPAGDGFNMLELATACMNDTLTTCVGGKQLDIPCASFGQDFTCQQVGGRFFCGLASECHPEATDASACQAGDQLKLCVAGTVTRTDCNALGFAGCRADTQHCEYELESN